MKTQYKHDAQASLLPLTHSLALRACMILGLNAFTILVTTTCCAELPLVAPSTVGMNGRVLKRIETVFEEGLSDGEMAGCVVCVGRGGRIAFLEAFGHRQVEPAKVKMTSDTVFDMASITKPVATATSVMMLVERGQVRLRDRVSLHLPEFGQNGKDKITIQDLLIHQGGLIPDNAISDYEVGVEKALERVYALETYVEPGSKFVYTDVGFIVLAELIRRKTGQSVHEFSQEHVFRPLGMYETGYLPAESLRSRAAATEQRDGKWMRGEVHDPRSFLLGGVAGHAGLFSTARDLAIYAQMMLNGGIYRGQRVLSRRTVTTMTAPYTVSRGLRGLGWDKQSGYSSNRGELFSPSAFGHGGFTGTSLWIDPDLNLFTIFLSTRLHPDGKGYVNDLGGRVGNIAAAAIQAPGQVPAPRPTKQPVQVGIDVLETDGFAELAGQRVGLITNHTGISRDGRSTVEILHSANNVQLAALFSPEHGFAGRLEQARIDDDQDKATGLLIHSLYGQTRRPTPEMLDGIDTLVFDIQDIGTRFYTYVSTMGEAMKAAADQDVRFVVLDRPNPIGGVVISGPVLDGGRESFVGFHALPVRHGMTVGELAQMFRDELDLDLRLEVVRVKNWRRSDWFDSTGLLWVNPSPNMRNSTQALIYPGVGLLETTNLSVGRGTDTPFEVIGAPWLNGQRLAVALNRAHLPGVRFVPLRFTLDASKFKDQECGGVRLLITNRKLYRPTITGWEIARQLVRLFPNKWNSDGYDRLLGDEQVLADILAAKPARDIEAGYQQELDLFRARRSKYLLY